MRAAVAISRHLDAVRACVDATEQAMRLSGQEGAPDLLWCASVAHSVEDTERGISMAQKRSGAREAVGNTCGGVLLAPSGQSVERDPCVAALLLYGDKGLQAWSGKARRPAGWTNRPMMVMVDPDGSPQQRLRMLQEAWDPRRVAGGAAAGVETDAAVIHHGVGAVEHVAVSPDAPVVEVALAQGVAPVGESMLVTRVEGNLVLELDGRPALGRALDQLSATERQEPGRALGQCMVGLQPAGADLADAVKRGAFAVRPLVGMAPDVGALAIGEAARAGDHVMLVKRDGPAAERAMAQALGALKSRLAGAAPVAGVYFTCVGRGAGLFGRAGAEAAILSRTMGKVPILGMQSSFEIGPLLDGPPSVHMFSGVLFIIAEGN